MSRKRYTYEEGSYTDFLLPVNYDNEHGVKVEVEEEVREGQKGQGVEDSNLDNDNLVD